MIHICSFSGPANYEIEVQAKRWRFDWSDRFGPSLIGRNGALRPPPSHVVQAIQWWLEQGREVIDGLCIWRRPPEPKRWHIAGRYWFESEARPTNLPVPLCPGCPQCAPPRPGGET